MNFDLQNAISILSRTPSVLRTLVAEVPEAWTHNDYGPVTWSVLQIIGHLIWGERTDWIPRTKHILKVGDERPFEPFDRAGHAELCRQHSLAELLDMFEQERADGLRELDQLSLSAEQLRLRGGHRVLGTVTLGQLLAAWTVHDLNHIAQAAKAMAFQYGDQVGAWREFLSILAPPRPR